MRNYYFISGLPRSGSTLLSSILLQNPKFYASIASELERITKSSIDFITHSENNFIITDDQRKNLMYGIFDGYYKHVNNPIIFDSSRYWTRRTSFLGALFPYTKILCSVRDIVSIINSFETIFSKNPFHSNIILDSKINIFERCDKLMDRDNGLIMKSWISLLEGYAINSDMIYFVEYENLCKNPEDTMKKIYQFLEMPYYEHDFKNLEYSNKNFDKACNLKDLHTVRKKVEYNPPKLILPKEIVDKYKKIKMEFWKGNFNQNYFLLDSLQNKSITYE